MKAFILGCIIALIGWQPSFAQNSLEEQEVIELSKEKRQWMADKNTEVLSALFHEKSVFVHMGGAWGKQAEIDVIKNGNIWYKKADVHEVSVEMGLTNYEMQGVIGCFMFSMWAFGSYFQSLGTTELFLLGIVIYILQLAFSAYWLKKHLYGQLEWFLRSATYLKAQPFRKEKNKT